VTNKDLFHGSGNSTARIPKNVGIKKVKLTDPHTSPGKLLPTTKVTKKGWSK